MPVAGTVSIGDDQVDVDEGDYLLYNEDGSISGYAKRQYFEDLYEAMPPLPDPTPIPEGAPRRAQMWGSR